MTMNLYLTDSFQLRETKDLAENAGPSYVVMLFFCTSGCVVLVKIVIKKIIYFFIADGVVSCIIYFNDA